jgi:hypothetical protein
MGGPGRFFGGRLTPIHVSILSLIYRDNCLTYLHMCRAVLLVLARLG